MGQISERDSSDTYTECKYGGPLGRGPGRIAWKWG